MDKLTHRPENGVSNCSVFALLEDIWTQTAIYTSKVVHPENGINGEEKSADTIASPLT